MMPATASMRSSTPAMRCSATASTRCSATQAGASACRIALCLSALLDMAEGAGADVALTAGFCVSPSRLGVSFERPDRYAGTSGNSAAHSPSPTDVATA